ncbi:hypothetical protein SAMN05216326_15214 [Nitrosomonas marina]|uniref:Uncharacterized protein n=1 Tax=Nitrosomonas marina TaxID=917 RepID=A0A1I0G2T9_9PROT|nr:hypothetical protein [Nitrosomonas marina]SET65218.1 hypothetical protein SAMN05216326_15214 [Nitrosomonas marina]
MGNIKIKWLVYTVLIGLIPVFSRFLVWLVTNDTNMELMVSADLVTFGLILHVSNINEIEHLTFEDHDRNWKTVQNGLSIIFIVFYSLLFALTLIDDGLVDLDALKLCTQILAVISFMISYSVYDRISKTTSNI